MLKKRPSKILLIMVINALLNSEAFAEPLLGLPWQAGEIWEVSQSYHKSMPGGNYALDFKPLQGRSTAVVASAGGTAYARENWDESVTPCANNPNLNWKPPSRTIRIDHGEGWETAYTHIADFSVLGITPGGPGVRVAKGQIIAYRGDQGCTSGPHLDYELLYNGFAQAIPYFEGRVKFSFYSSRKELSPISENYLYGDQYLSYNYAPAASTWHPNGTLIRAVGDTKVYFLEGGKKRWVYDETAFEANGFSWEDVVEVSSEELSCYDTGDTIYAQCLLLGGLDEENFNHCNNGMGGGFEDPPNEVSFAIADSNSGVGGGFDGIPTFVFGDPADMPNDYSTGNPPPAPDQVVAGNNMLFAARHYDGESLQGFSSAGTKLWGMSGTGEIAFDGVDILAIGCENDVYKTLVHIDPASGAIKSSFRLAFDGDIGNCGTRSQMSLWSDRLYILSPSGNFLYAIRKSDGALLWKRSSGYGWESDKFFDAGFAPTVSADGTVYLARENGSLVAVNVDGTIKWEKNLGGNNFPPKVGPDGTIFYVLYDTAYSYVYAFNPVDGSQKWQAVKETGLILKAADSNGIYVRSGSLLISLDPVNGNEKFRQDIGSWESLLTGTNGTIYVPRDGYVLALSPTTGQELGRYVSSEFNHTSTALVQRSGGSMAVVTGTSPYKVSFLTAVANPPLADAQSVSVNEDTPRTIELTGAGPNAEPVTFSIAASPSHGVLGEIQPNNRYSAKVVYTPSPGYFGSDSFTFRTNDGISSSSPATVSLTVTAVVSANPPIAESQSVSVNGAPAEITLIGWGPNGEPVTFSIASMPLHGTLGAIAAHNRYSAKVTYTPAPGYVGSDSFTFRTNDGTGYSAAATVSVTVR